MSFREQVEEKPRENQKI